MKPASLREVRASLLCAFILALASAGCGEDAGSPTPFDAAADVPPGSGCTPTSVAGFVPTWKPPRPVPGACTNAEIDSEFRLCENEPTYDLAACTKFNRDLANATCRSCLYSTEDESSYGPILILRNRLIRVNIPGCLALADGDKGAAGCGARAQAAVECELKACTHQCVTGLAFSGCRTNAAETVCRSFVDDTPCGDRSTYSACVDYATYDEYFRGISNVFCGAGISAGGLPSARATKGARSGGDLSAAVGQQGWSRRESFEPVQRVGQGVTRGGEGAPR